MTRGLARGERVVLATHNQGKILELRVKLEAAGLSVTDAASLGLSAPAETAPDFRGNASLKAIAAARAAGLPALADDSGFAIDALDGAPGVFSARWIDRAGSREAALQRLYEQARGSANRSARFVCVLALAWPDGVAAVCEGIVEGRWVWPPRGAGGFGYDPMFVPDGSSRTFAEMTSAEKQAISHRARALAGLAALLPA